MLTTKDIEAFMGIEAALVRQSEDAAAPPENVDAAGAAAAAWLRRAGSGEAPRAIPGSAGLMLSALLRGFGRR